MWYLQLMIISMWVDDTLLPESVIYMWIQKEDGSLYIVADPNEEQLAYISEQLEDAKVREML